MSIEDRWPSSAVRDAMEILGGLPIDLAQICRVTDQAAKKWLRNGRIPDSQHAVLVARECLRRGRPITVDRLSGLDEVDGPAPEDLDGAGSRSRNRSPSSRCRTQSGDGAFPVALAAESVRPYAVNFAESEAA